MCFKRSKCCESLAAKTCMGANRTVEGAHRSHNLLVLPELTICTVCGAYSSYASRLLARPCRSPKTAGSRNLSQVAKGWHPQSKERLGGQAPPMFIPPVLMYPSLESAEEEGPAPTAADDPLDEPQVVGQADQWEGLALEAEDEWLQERAAQEEASFWEHEPPWLDGPWGEPP